MDRQISSPNIVRGTVSDRNNRKLTGLLVKAFDRDMRSQGFLGKCITDRKGKYEISYTAADFNYVEKENADLRMRVYAADGSSVLFETKLEDILFNASDDETINIIITGEIPREGNDFDNIIGEISGLIGKVKIPDLQENDEHCDITFLSKETGVRAEKLEHLVVAHRLSVKSKIDAAFFYALLRKNTLLKNDFTQAISLRLSVGIDNETLPLLYQAALTDEKNVQSDTAAAVNEMLVPDRVSTDWKRNYDSLQQFRQKAQDYYQIEHPKRMLNIVSRFVFENKIGEIPTLFRKNNNDLDTVFKKMSDASFFPDESKAKDAKTSLLLTQLLGADDAIISVVKETRNIKNPEDIREIAKFNKADWKKILTESAGKIEVGGRKLDKKLIDYHASFMARKMERKFPGTAFTAQLEREKSRILENQDEIRTFLVKHDDFDLRSSNIDLFIKEKKLTGATEAMRTELKSVQRIFRLVPHYSKTNALLKRNISSAQSITAVGENRFVNEIARESGISGSEAKMIYDTAERTSTAAMLVAGELQGTLRAMDVSALSSTSKISTLKVVGEDFPNLKSLFRMTDVCACEHCRSVYSPAAYLVEILQFLSKRSVTDLTTKKTSNFAKDILFNQRRADLGDIDLSCDNANTPVPYIDLVCELLEEKIAPDAGISFTGKLAGGSDAFKGKISATLLNALQKKIPVTADAQIFKTEYSDGSTGSPYYLRDKKAVCKITFHRTIKNKYIVKRLRQTLSSAGELAAAPEYVNSEAYAKLRTSSFAFKLPFDLDQTEARAYFSRFGIERAKLMKDFQAPRISKDGKITAIVPKDEEIAAEALNLTEAERDLIIKPDASSQPTFWNKTTAEMKVVDTFLTKTGLSYSELELLLALRFINSDGKLFIRHLQFDSCDTAEKEIADLDNAALDRIHRFLRWQKKTGWAFETLDQIICQKKLGDQKLDAIVIGGVTNGEKCLIKAADLKIISEKTGIKLEELIGFYGEIPFKELTGATKNPLYQQIFLNKAKNGFIDETLLLTKENGLVDENFLPSEAKAKAITPSQQTSLAACLRLTEQDLGKLLTLRPNGKLTFAILSFLFAASRLMQTLKLKADDFVILSKLTGINIQDSPAATLQFVEAAFAAGRLPLKLADVEFMIRHEAMNLAEREIKTEKIEETLKKLQAEFQKAFTANISPFDKKLTAEAQKETLQNLVSKLGNISEADSKIFAGLVDADWTFKWTDKTGAEIKSTNPAQAIVFLEDRLNDLFSTVQIKAVINALAAALVSATTANNKEEAALKAIDAARTAILNAENPAATAAAKAQLNAAQKAEVIISAAAKAADAHFESGRKALLKLLLDSLADYFFRDAKKKALVQIIAATFKVSKELAETVIKYARLRQIPPGFTLISDVLQTDELIDKKNTPVLPKIPGTTSPQFDAIRLLHKLFPLISSFKLANEDVGWHLQNNLSLGWFRLDGIPYRANQNTINYLFYTNFVKMLSTAGELAPVPDPADAKNPLTFYKLATMLLPAAAEPARDKWIDAFSLLTGYEKTDVDKVDAHLFPNFSIDNYRKADNWKRVKNCLEHLRKLGVNVSQAANLVKQLGLTAAETSLLRTALKSRYDEEVWLETLKQITDAIRPQKRDALVAYLLATNPDFKDENDLYDHFLVDVEMEACMPSSRIVQAHGTIQLFVQRCLMGLEPRAVADLNTDKKWAQWKWMKNYRVWEANRKVFLYPENWIEAELRDDKSFLFRELENELLQNDLNAFTAEEAIINYLEKLDNIAFLEVIATWYQSDIKTMHVFARTKGGDPAIYYYRKFEQEMYWTPWEKVELDITGDHLIAFVRNNRLCLAWLVFSEEPEPKPQATIPANQKPGATVDLEKPKRKLVIQLAVSEFANKKWQPKKISKDAIRTPSVYVATDLPRKAYNIFYLESLEQIYLFSAESDEAEQVQIIHSILPGEMQSFQQSASIVTGDEGSSERYQLNGIFNMTGCKGYPELAYEGNMPFTDIPLGNGFSLDRDFLPDFNHAVLNSQRYIDTTTGITPDAVDDLSVRNGSAFLESFNSLMKTPGKPPTTNPSEFIQLLAKTPNNFKITYPLQITFLDKVALSAQVLSQLSFSEMMKNYKIKIPFGTLLPYFMEDSFHSYVIIPGYYREDKDSKTNRPIYTKRAGSDILQLWEDFKNLREKYNAQESDSWEVLIAKFGNDALWKKVSKELELYQTLKYGEQFKNMYHPLVCPLKTTLYKGGVAELMKWKTQMQGETPSQKVPLKFDSNYNPSDHVPRPYPVEDIDFSSDGSYSGYNWELFFHVPFLIATRLTKNQRFEEALEWFHYMFDPTGASEGAVPQKYWVTKPFYQMQEEDYKKQQIDALLYDTANPNSPEIDNLQRAVNQWRDKPFQPHAIARFRPVAYQKALLMKYIDNLTEWGDYLFRQDTMESITQATQMYILADKLLGPKPRTVPPVVKAPFETYNQIEQKLDAFGNALIGLENILPDLSALPNKGKELPPPPPVTLAMLYFCIPQNDKMLAYWDRIAERLFNIRHCRNIEGVERSLALFAPPIDPGMLVRAAASGLDISSVLAGLNAPTPFYRFNVLSQKATELTQEVRSLGSSLLQALEKKDAEAMSLLRNEMELKILNAVRDVKLKQISEAREQITILQQTQAVVEERDKYYTNIEKVIPSEQLHLDKLDKAHNLQEKAQGIQLLASLYALLPDLDLGVSGFGATPVTKLRFGGLNVAQASKAASDVMSYLSTMASNEAARASIQGGYDRRFDDWKLQERLAKKELEQIKKQIAAAEIRCNIAEAELKNHDTQIENAKKTDEFMRSKFTNKELYEWTIGQISSVYFKAYQLAYDFAKKAERCYRFELGNDDGFIGYGYWDSMKKGLQSADQLFHDIKRMETSYLDKNKREYEITKHISLSMLDPLALIKLRATGVCDFEVPEAIYDMDHPGQYFRRIKSVSVSLPCIAGPYTSVSAKLSLVSNKYRKNATAGTEADYMENPGNDERFVYNVGAIQSIAASNSQNDSGMFELNFRDERYLPFEGCGAIGKWRLELPKKVRQFDYSTISDVVLHVKYTSREGGGLREPAEMALLKNLSEIKQQLSQSGLHVALNMKHDLPNEWHLLKTKGTVDLSIAGSRLPYFVQTIEGLEINNAIFIARAKTNPASCSIQIDGAPVNLSKIDEWNLCRGNKKDISLEKSFKVAIDNPLLNDLEDLIVVLELKVAS